MNILTEPDQCLGNVVQGCCLVAHPQLRTAHSTPNRNVACYAVKEKDGFIWVGKPTREGAGERGGEHDDGLEMI